MSAVQPLLLPPPPLLRNKPPPALSVAAGLPPRDCVWLCSVFPGGTWCGSRYYHHRGSSSSERAPRRGAANPGRRIEPISLCSARSRSPPGCQSMTGQSSGGGTTGYRPLSLRDEENLTATLSRTPLTDQLKRCGGPNNADPEYSRPRQVGIPHKSYVGQPIPFRLIIILTHRLFGRAEIYLELGGWQFFPVNQVGYMKFPQTSFQISSSPQNQTSLPVSRVGSFHYRRRRCADLHYHEFG